MRLLFSLLLGLARPTAAFVAKASNGGTTTSRLSLQVSPESQLAQLASMTVLSIDSGDLDVIRDYAATGYITDATTNPLFVSQAGLRGDAVYAKMVDDAVRYAVEQAAGEEESAVISLAIDRLAVNLGKSISDIVTGYV